MAEQNAPPEKISKADNAEDKLPALGAIIVNDKPVLKLNESSGLDPLEETLRQLFGDDLSDLEQINTTPIFENANNQPSTSRNTGEGRIRVENVSGKTAEDKSQTIIIRNYAPAKPDWYIFLSDSEIVRSPSGCERKHYFVRRVTEGVCIELKKDPKKEYNVLISICSNDSPGTSDTSNVDVELKAEFTNK